MIVDFCMCWKVMELFVNNIVFHQCITHFQVNPVSVKIEISLLLPWLLYIPFNVSSEKLLVHQNYHEVDDYSGHLSA